MTTNEVWTESRLLDDYSRPMNQSGRNIPAAHSMDTEWFAVDEDGHVARLATNEGGAVPEGGGFPHGDSRNGGSWLWLDEQALVAAALKLLAGRDSSVASVLDEFELSAEDVAPLVLYGHPFDGQRNALGCLGLFVYRCQSQQAAPYPLLVRPAHPLVFDELPEEVRSQFQPGYWPERFEHEKLIQPLEATALSLIHI